VYDVSLWQYEHAQRWQEHDTVGYVLAAMG
jgi:hypothetical protein